MSTDVIFYQVDLCKLPSQWCMDILFTLCYYWQIFFERRLLLQILVIQSEDECKLSNILPLAKAEGYFHLVNDFSEIPARKTITPGSDFSLLAVFSQGIQSFLSCENQNWNCQSLPCNTKTEGRCLLLNLVFAGSMRGRGGRWTVTEGKMHEANIYMYTHAFDEITQATSLTVK